MSIQGLADGIADFFFDQLEVEGADQVPADRPVIFAANHHSGLIDALLLYSATPREIRAVGKSTLWDILPLRPFLHAADVIPVKRVRDGGGSNDEAFAEVSQALLGGDAIVIFVEGTSHDNPGLAPIKTGAARMAFDAMAQGARPVIIPVGIVFEDRERFRSNALVRFGEVIDVAELHPGATTGDRDQVRDLTTQVEAGLAVVAPVWESEAQRAAARTSAMEQLPVGAPLSAIEARAEELAELRPASLSVPDPDLVGERGEAKLLPSPPDQLDTLAALVLAPFAIVGKWGEPAAIPAGASHRHARRSQHPGDPQSRGRNDPVPAVVGRHRDRCVLAWSLVLVGIRHRSVHRRARPACRPRATQGESGAAGTPARAGAPAAAITPGWLGSPLVDFAVISDLAELSPSDDRDTARRFLGAASGTGFDADRARILELVDAHEDIAVRTCRPGHLTGSAFVVDPSRNAGLLLFHTKLQKWLQPGGHADGDTNLAAVALKEATEETGIEGLRVVGPAIDVDIHRVDPPAEDAHLHLDVRFLVLAPAGAEPVGNHESQGFRWLDADELQAGDYEAGLKRMAQAAFPLARQLA